jgi:SAM-dependent methyltransferase
VTWRRAAFGASRRFAHGLELAARGLVHLGAGLLRPEDLRRVTIDRWDRFGDSDRFIDSGLLGFEAALYPRYLAKDDAILLVGCGTGRDLVALLRAGYRVDAIEPAPRAAERARAALRQRGLVARVITGEVDALPAKAYDAIVLTWYCYSYIPGRAARVAMLARLRGHLQPGGRILVSYVTADARAAALPLAITRAAARASRAGWAPEPDDVLRAEGGGLHYEHRFRPAEFEEEARDAGLRPLRHDCDDEGRAVLTGNGGRLAPEGDVALED